ncbi:MAG: fibronectin type III domain-containing protein [Acidobacteriota bacterium]
MKNCVLTILLVTVLAGHSYSQHTQNEFSPQRIILNLTQDPSHSMAVTWRTESEITNPVVQISEAGSFTEFAENSRNFYASKEKINPDSGKSVFYYSVVTNELKPSTLYAYRVGGDEGFSEWNQFTTADDKTSPLTFAFFGDPQDDINEYCSRVFRQAYKEAPEANFWLFTGDITTEPADRLWGEFYQAGGFIFREVPLILTPGNHDMKYKVENGNYVLDKKGKKARTKEVAPLWRAQFTLPDNGPDGFSETSYFVDYQGVRFIMINSNNKLNEQAKWLDSILTDNKNMWTVVSFHHPVYSSGRERNDKSTRNAFLTVFDKNNVDLILQGHDHSYARSYKLKNGLRVNDNEKGTVYVTSVSGPKAYIVNSLYSSLMAKMGTNLQLFQLISIDKDRLSFKSFTAEGALYDSFELTK